MLKIYGKREEELRLLAILAEFKVRVTASYPIKGMTRKIEGTNAHLVKVNRAKRLIEFTF